MKTISSDQTFLFKVLLPVVWITVFGVGTLGLWLGSMHGKNGALPPDEMKWQFLGLWLVGAAFVLWGCAGLKVVRMDASCLYVSNYRKEVSIPLEKIMDVTENRWINIHPVTIHFRESTHYGFRVTFMPKSRPFSLSGSHPVVAELKQRAGLV